MGGFSLGKRSVTSTTSNRDKRTKRDTGGSTRSSRTNNTSRVSSTRGSRGQKRKSSGIGGEEEEEDIRPSQRHVLYEDDEEDELLGLYKEAGGTIVGDNIWIPPKAEQKEHELKGERLIIEKIVCENFKSYGGIKEMGPFHKSFSAIVGPNGNGKSNIIDALLFVFGYRSTKIRCKKMSLLIHKSELLPNISSTTVTVHFVKILDEGDENSVAIVPDSRITVMRSVDKHNVSVYKLDGKPVQFHEVAEFLKNNGVDIIHNRFLILQGEVESISQLPPKRRNQHESGLLEFLEEVIGTKRYMKCLHQLEEAIDKLNFNREAKLFSVDLVEKELMALKEPVSKAKEYLREQNAVTRSKHQLQQLQIQEIKTELGDLEKQKKEAEDKIAETDKALAELKDGNSEREKEFLEKEKRVKTLEQDGHRFQKIITSTEAKFTKVKEQIQNDNTRRKTVKKEITVKEKELEVLEEVPTKSEKEIKILGKRRDDLDAEIGKEEEIVKKEMVKIEAEVEKYSAESKVLTKAFVEAKAGRDAAKKKSEALESELKVAKERSEGEERKLETLKQELEDLKNKIKENERSARSSLGNKVATLEKGLQEKKVERDAVHHEERVVELEYERARAAYADARQMFQDSQTDDAIYKAFFDEKAKGRLGGVYGRLRDLATIDEKYNVAATVSTGMWDHWVVDSEVTGEEAINFLRQRNLPFQNFQCLSKLQRYLQTARQPFKAPPNSHRIFDLIKVNKPEVTSAFYKALGNTLVADNIDIGSDIAYAPQNRSKVATLAGEIIDPSGAMTGGGRQKIIGKMNGRMAARLERSMSEREYQDIKETLDVAQKKYNDLFTKRQALDNEIQSLGLKFRDAQEKINSAKTDPEAMKRRIVLKEKQVADQAEKVKTSKLDPKYLKAKETELAALVQEFEDAMEPCTAAEAAAKKVESKLKLLRGEKTKEIRKKLDFSLEQRKKVIEDFDRHTIALRNYDANHEKLVAAIENLKNEKTRLETEMLELEEKRKELTDKGIEVANEMEAIKTELEAGKKELQVLKKAMSEVNKKRGELESRRSVEAIELGNATGRFKAIAGKVDSIKRKMGDLKLEDIPNEDVEPLRELTEQDFENLNAQDLEEFIAKTTQELKKMNPNLLILEQYKNKVDEFLRKVSVLDEITLARDTHRNVYVSTLLQRLTEFMNGFAIISLKLKEMFRMISMGGDAELDLVDSTDPYSLGINFCVRPAGKSWKNISHLSGGEKTLSSLALIFALHHFKPSPFYVMDEIDAALDFKNVSIIANYIKDRTKFTQFVIVSLRANMFELADSMIGIVKVNNISFPTHLGVSKLLSQLREKFLEAGRTFPLENEYMANNRCHRQQELVKLVESKKKKEAEDNLFNANYSIINEEEDDLLPNLSQDLQQGTGDKPEAGEKSIVEVPGAAESGETVQKDGGRKRVKLSPEADKDEKNKTAAEEIFLEPRNLSKILEEEEEEEETVAEKSKNKTELEEEETVAEKSKNKTELEEEAETGNTVVEKSKNTTQIHISVENIKQSNSPAHAQLQNSMEEEETEVTPASEDEHEDANDEQATPEEPMEMDESSIPLDDKSVVAETSEEYESASEDL